VGRERASSIRQDAPSKNVIVEMQKNVMRGGGGENTFPSTTTASAISVVMIR
jgi:hypothetical protein